MGDRRRRLRRILQPIGLALAVMSLCLMSSLSGCNVATIVPSSETLPQVSAVANPTLPDWIEEISPTGQTKPQAQIRVRFKEPLIPLERLESPDQQALLSKFELLPPLKGQFRFLTPRMVGFQADQPIPLGTRVKVTLKAGLADLQKHQLSQDLAWSFTTEAIKLTDLTTSYPDPKQPPEAIEIRPVLKVTSNQALDLASLQEHAQLTAAGQTSAIGLKAALESPTAPDSVTDTWIYTLQPLSELAKGTRYQLELSPGIRPAKGNLPTETAIRSEVETYSQLAFRQLSYETFPGSTTRFVQGIPQLEFSNGIQAESAIGQITIAPEPKTKDVPLVRAYDGERLVSLNPWALAPKTNYTVTIGADLQDKFGQRLGQAQTVQLTTSDLAAQLWAPSDLHIFPTSQSALQLNVSTVNLAGFQSATAIVQPTDLVYTNSAYPSPDRPNLLADPSRWATTQVKAEKNQSLETPIPLQKLLGRPTGMVAYGVKARTTSYQEDNQQTWNEPTFYGLVQITNLGVFAQWFPDSGLVRVHRLSDGQPVANATVQIYQSQLEAKTKGQPSPCATGKTDAAGLWAIAPNQFSACASPQADRGPQLLVIAQQDQDWAFTRSYDYSGAFDYGIDAGWPTRKPEPRGTIFSDRTLYQPGETGYFTAAAYYLQGGQLRQDPQTRYTVTLESPDGRKQELAPQTTNEFGTFSVELPIGKTQPLGFYTLRAKAENGNEILGTFRVAEFRPPNFQVKLAVEGAKSEVNGQAIALPNQTLTAQVQSSYLFGAPVDGGEVEYFVTRQRQDFSPKGWESFNFGRRWFWPEEAPEVPTDVLQVNQTLNNQGQGQQTVTIGGELPYAMTYRVDAQVKDVANLAVTDSKSIVALPSDRLVGLKTDFVATANQAFPVQVIVADPQGQPVTDQTVKLELQELIYHQATRLVEGSYLPQTQVDYRTVANAEVRSGQTAAEVSLTPPKSGSYRIRAQIPGSPEASATDVQIWATGANAIWGDRYSNNRLELKLDQSTYKAGDTATVLLQSPYPEAELYFAVVRDKVLYQTVTKVSGSAPKLQFPVTPEMLPNAAVEAILVRQGQSLGQVEPGSVNKLVRIGFAPFAVDLSDRRLQIGIQPSAGTDPKAPAAPGSEQTLNLSLTNDRNQPVSGQVTVMVVNEAILQLTGYRPPDLLKTVYAEQPITVRLSDNRPDVVLQPIGSPIDKGWGYGGGLSDATANTRTRTEFKPVAYYNATLRTNAQGQAQVKFKLPDDLTTWRVMAVATATPSAPKSPTVPSWQFGLADTTFITSKPLIVSPLLPQFARPGDRFQVGASVTNLSGQTGTLTVTSQADAPLKLEQSGQQQTQAEPDTKAYRFPATVEKSGPAKLTVAAEINGLRDEVQLPLEVRSLEVTEQVAQTGVTRRPVKIPFKPDPQVDPTVGELQVSLANTLIPPVLTAAATQEAEPFPWLEPNASQLLLAAHLQALSAKYGATALNLGNQMQQAIGQLQALQTADGGLAAYPGGKSDPFLTPYAAQAIARAQKVSPTEDWQTLARSVKVYLQQLLADPGRSPGCKEAQCKNAVRLQSLLALAELGEPRRDFLADLYEQRQTLDTTQQLQLARYLTQFPDWQASAKRLTQDLQEVIQERGRSARVSLPRTWQWLNSSTVTQAEALRLFLAQNQAPDRVEKLLQGLLDQRRNGTWPTQYDTAIALTALADYSARDPQPAKLSVIAKLGDKELIKANFEGYRQSNQQVTVPSADLPRQPQDLLLQPSGQGNLHYQVAYRYRLQGNPPGQLSGLRVTRLIRPAKQEQVLHRIGLYAPQSLQLPVGQVYEVAVEVITDHPVDHVLITDPLPAGLEAIDQSFQTNAPDSATDDRWQPDYQTIYRDRVVAVADRLDPGVYTLRYLARSVTSGTFLYPGATAQLQYAPEEFGRSAATTLEVSDR